MKFGVVFKEENKRGRELAKRVKEYLESKGQQVLDQRNLKGAEIIITLGGDGTLIHTACEYAHLEVPFVGINTGSLGFLTAAEARDWEWALEKLTKSEYLTSRRMTVEARVRRVTNAQRLKPFRAVNEVVIKGLYRVVDLEVAVDGEKLMKILGDGVIVSTQTGSTAYSLSAGGPIVDPNLDSILVTPINPIGLPIPSVVLSPDDSIAVKVTQGRDVSLVLDGQEHTKLVGGPADAKALAGRQSVVEIKRGEYDIRLIYFDKHQFIKSLNAKFGLSGRLGS